MTLYPCGYRTDLLSMDAMIARYGEHLHPEFHRRLFAWIESMDGLIGCGQTFRPVQPSRPGFAPPGMSFHEKQMFASGLSAVSAVDLVALARPGNPNQAHRSPTWEESGTAPNYGVYTFVKGEPWHMQCVEMRGYQTWVNAGRPDPGAFTLPSDVPPVVTPPPIITPNGESDMLIIDLNPGTAWWVAMMLAGDELTHLVNGHHVSVMVRGGVSRVTLGVPGGAPGEVELDGILRSVMTTNPSPFAPGMPAFNQGLHDLWTAARV